MAAKDLFWNSVVAGLHFEGEVGSYNFYEVAGRPVTVTGNVTISQTKKKFGATSAHFDGGSYLTINTPAMADFTFDFWINPTAHTDGVLLRANGGGDYCSADFSSGNVRFGNDATVVGPLSLVPIGVWTHIVFQRLGNTRYFFVNGELKHQSAIYTGGPACGMQFFGAHDSGDFNGYVDDLRVTSAARWVADFTPPTEPFPHGGYEVGGTILTLEGTPVARKVRIYRRDTGAFLGEGITNAVTGAYVVPVAYSGEVSVVMLDDELGTLENDQILRTTPI